MEESPGKESEELKGQSGENDELGELINTLEEQRKEHESTGKFLDAETVNQRIIKLKQEQRKRFEDQLRLKQEKEIANNEEKYSGELKTFNADWDDRIEKYKAKCKESEEELRRRQVNEYETESARLEKEIPIIPKHSSEFLNFKRIQDTLVRNKEYKEAHMVQQNMVDLEEKEKLTWGQDRLAKIQQALAVVSKRQENEVGRLIQKAHNGFGELKKQRAAELESLVKKYQNLQKEMKIAHKLEINRFNGLHTTGSGVFKSDFTVSSRKIFSSKSLKQLDSEKLIQESGEVEVA